MVQIREEVRGLKGINFRTLLETQPTRMNIIITFMSILELMKVGAITIRQEETFGEIVIDSLDEIEVTSESENRLEDEVTFADDPDEAAVAEEENQEADRQTGEE